jgi:hypothetical protein
MLNSNLTVKIKPPRACPRITDYVIAVVFNLLLGGTAPEIWHRLIRVASATFPLMVIGKETRRALVLILHDSSKPPTTAD